MSEYATTETRVSIAGFDERAIGITPPSNPDRRGVFLADVIVELGLADQETIETAVRTAQETEKPLERHLLDAGILDEDHLSRAIAERNGFDHVDLDQFEVDMGAAELVAGSAAQRYSAVPVAFASDGALIVAVKDPFDSLGISDIEVMTRSQVRPAIASATSLETLIERLPEQAAAPPLPPEPEEVEMSEDEQTVDESALVDEQTSEEPMIELVEPEPELDPSANGDSVLPPPAELEALEIEPTIEVELVEEPDLELISSPSPSRCRRRWRRRREI